ncbi:lysophospholipid acyltransferase family protein [Streptomyces radiopugnans]|uniref:1-acyl-sn-glycerol-3-phosphate acyltransferases n=1 Tax=Streptomyces radiopugnans TaxID=403935 RepID=A0A1H9B627_9ACTN|nr:lysophospholipid acyltransferase family protein [Streptomyces radiopugnans]SEP84490.1 1-acyl-sn-glycerol-3-phosphate acyltransferases [Streptomyces radiopugnans]
MDAPERAEPRADPWFPFSPCTVAGCLPRRPAAAGAVRRSARWAALAAVLPAGVALSPVVRRLAPARRAVLVRWWGGAIATALGVRVRVTGGPAAGPALVVANHVSWLDVPLLAAVAPGRMVAKREVGRYPVLGRLAARGGTLFIDRERLRSLPGTVAEVAGALRAGSTVVAFPEGSTRCGRELGPFRGALFQAALEAGVPVQPVAIRYRAHSTADTADTADGPGVTDTAGAVDTRAAFVGDDALAASLRRVAAARGLVAEVTVLPPLPPGAHPDRRALAAAAREAVETALGTGARAAVVAAVAGADRRPPPPPGRQPAAAWSPVA